MGEPSGVEASVPSSGGAVNSVVSFHTGDMLFDPFDFIVEITKYITMQPGDVLWMGADGTLPIAPGDTVEINISGIGTLRNRFE